MSGNYLLRRGLVGAWAPFRGVTGTTVIDFSEYRRDGTFVNTPAWNTTRGILNLDFVRADDDEVTVTFPEDEPFLEPAGLSCFAMVNPDTNAGNGCQIFGKSVTNGIRDNPLGFAISGTAFEPSPGALYTNRANATDYNLQDGVNTVTLGEWNVVGCTFTDNLCETSPTLWINGKSETGANFGGSATGPATGTNETIRLGRRADGTPEMEGHIAWICVWSRPLSRMEAQLLYATQGRALFDPWPERLMSGAAVASSSFVPGSWII